MKTKAKKFSHKLLALFMAVLMAMTCFSGVLTSYAASVDTGYVDDELEYNSLGWNVLSDEQVATALLDYADSLLPALQAMEPQLAELVNNADIPVLTVNWDTSKRQITAKVIGVTLATVTVKLGSVDELIETLTSIQSVIDGGLVSTATKLGVDLGNITDLNFSSVKGMTRETTSSTDIVRGVLGIIYNNNDKIIGGLLRGELSLGLLDDSLNVYKIIGNLFGLDADTTKANMVYNIVQSLLFNNTNWFTQDEIDGYKADPSSFVYDDVLLQKMTTELLDKISVRVTYADETNSKSRLQEIEKLMKQDSLTYEDAATKLGYDPNLVYSDEDYGNVLLFAYGDDMIELTPSDSLFSFGLQAMKMAWQTVLKDTVKLLHVNNDVDRGHGTNFDNAYYYWASANIEGGWVQTDLEAMYSEDNINAWANAVYEEYTASSPDEFLTWVKYNYEYDRTVADDAEGTWADIDSTTLFNKVRYSPLADYGFDMQTGPINLYFLQTGDANIDAFFDTFLAGNYNSLVAALNDGLVAAVKDIFVDRDNIYSVEKGDKSVPTMATSNETVINSESIGRITNTLVSNALKIVQYTADTTDNNILNGFYKNNGADAVLSETNLEEAMIPMLIACVGNVSLNDNGNLAETIHPEDWDACKDAEGVAFIALREYLSYVLPNKDYNNLVTKDSDGKYEATLEGTILPMARDAIVYVIEPYVPVTDSNGNKWTADTTNVDTKETVFTLLNSVITYYADMYQGKDWTNSKRSAENALGVGPLLGLVDEKGVSTIDKEVRTDDAIWNNIDKVVNKFFPMLGTLQGSEYGEGKFSSYDLIWNDIVKGVLNIADTNEKTGLCGVSNFIYRFLTIISATPIQSNRIIDTVYDFAQDLINGVFGPRYTGQVWIPIPDRSSSHPFDDLVQKDALARSTSNDQPGAILVAINNFVEFSGYGYNGVATYPDSILPGLMFAVSAVNSFTNILPSLSDSTMELATVEFSTDTFSGCVSGTEYSSTLTFTNNSYGLNVAYLDGINSEVNQLSRYYIQITSATVSGPSTASITGSTSKLIKPGESIDLTVSSKYAESDDKYNVYTVTIKYNIVDSNGNTIQGDNVTYAYEYLTSASNWEDTVYPESRWSDSWNCRQLPTEVEGNLNKESATYTYNGYKFMSTAYFGDTSSNARWVAQYPEYIVLSTDNLSAVDDYGVRFYNVKYKSFGATKSIDGLYYYDSKQVWDDQIGDYVTVGSDNAIAIIDKTTGNILKYGTYDYSTDGGETWSTTNVSYADVEAARDALQTVDEVKLFTYRVHVVYSLQDALDAGAVKAYHYDADSKEYEYVYLQSASSGNFKYDSLLSNISTRGPIDGFYVNSVKLSNIKTENSGYLNIMKYDGETEVQGGIYDANVNFYHSKTSGQATFNFAICDVSNASNVRDKYTELTEVLSNYKADDFAADTTVYEDTKTAAVKALSTIATQITPDTAKQLNDETQRTFVTKSSTSVNGDKAYTLMTQDEYNALDANAKNLLYKGTDGHYYFDSDFKAPAYSYSKDGLTTATNGTDEAGFAVNAVQNSNGSTTYYIANTVQYATDWVTDGIYQNYPIKLSTGEQAVDSNGNALYDQIQWIYYNSKGEKVSSGVDWAFKVPETSYQLVPATTENDTRGLYTKTNDLLEYTIDQIYASLDATIAEKLFTNVSLVREGLNEKNFDIITFNKMVDAAKSIEKKYTISVTYTEDGETQEANISYSNYSRYAAKYDDLQVTGINSTLSSTQINELQRLFNFYLGKVVERGYLGNQLESEIKCASANTYNNLIATVEKYEDVVGDNGTVTSVKVQDASITKGANAVDPEFGAWSADGKLVNEGDIVYSDALWNNYVVALANAVNRATLGNSSDYPSSKNYYDTTFDYDADVTGCYTADTVLQIAEIALENTKVITVNEAENGTIAINDEEFTTPVKVAVSEDDTAKLTAIPNSGYAFTGFEIDGEFIPVDAIVNGDPAYTVDENGLYSYNLKVANDVTVTPVFEEASTGITITGTVTIATDVTGTKYTSGIVGINIVANGEVVATSADDGTFTAVVPAGTTELTLTGSTTIDRTVTLSGTSDIADVNIPIVICDYNKDKKVNSADMATFSSSFGQNYNVYCDFNGDAKVNSADSGVFTSFMGKTVVYADLSLD